MNKIIPYLVLDQSGKSVLSGQLSSETAVVDISKLFEGIYLKKINNEKLHTYKII
ncbi:hypothetical protein [Flavobacterium adhaerens]|uniref:hypothetical protein n=1 Tax=Flavobacterium adhaerens TaxID=3149043 RepID=UPI0032B476A0